MSAPYKNLTFSVIIYPRFLTATQSFSLNIVTSLALYQVVARYLPDQLAIKWPNDLYCGDKKLSGVLIENVVMQKHLKASVVGIGLNVNQTNFHSEGPTSLAHECGSDFDLQQVLDQLLVALECNYLQLQAGWLEQLSATYLKNMYWLDDLHTFRDATHSFSGKIRGIDAWGRLIIELATGELKYYDAKKVSFVA